MVNVAPRPSDELTSSRPPCASTTARVTRQPETRAGHPVVEAHSRLEDPASLGGRNARTLIRHGDPNHVAASDRGDDDTGSVAVRQLRSQGDCRAPAAVATGPRRRAAYLAAISVSTTAPPSRAAATASATSVERSTASSRTETTPSATIRSIPRQAATARRTSSALGLVVQIRLPDRFRDRRERGYGASNLVDEHGEALRTEILRHDRAPPFARAPRSQPRPRPDLPTTRAPRRSA